MCISVLRYFLRVMIDPTSGCDCIAHACSFEHFVTLDKELEVTMDAIAEVEVIGQCVSPDRNRLAARQINFSWQLSDFIVLDMIIYPVESSKTFTATLTILGNRNATFDNSFSCIFPDRVVIAHQEGAVRVQMHSG